MKPIVQRLVLVSWLLTSAGFLFAQTPPPDVLHRLDRTTQNVRVKEVTDVEVFYTDLNAPATLRKVRKAELWKVVFGDGTSDVYNEPKANKPVVEAPAPNPSVTATSPRPVSPKPAAKPVTEMPTTAPAISTQSAGDIGAFLAGRKALSFGLNLTGSSTTQKNSRTSTTQTTNGLGLSVVYQQFKRDHVSVGGGLTIGLTRTKNTSAVTDIVESAPFIVLSGQTRRYLPVASNVAFYGFGSAELALQWDKYKDGSGNAETQATQQQLSLEVGAGLAYLFNERWSIDFNASLLGLTIDRYKEKSPDSKASVDLSLTGAGVIPAFSLFLTRYF